MHEQGSIDVRFSDIARAMSMTAPALYRYFSGRDELITTLLADAFEDLADRLEKALTELGDETPASAFSCVAQTYRRWALEDRIRFALVFGLPVAGYAPPPDGPQCQAGDRAFRFLLAPVLRARELGQDPRPILPELSERVAAAVAEANPASPVDPVVNLALLHGWAAIHGFVSLEVFGHMDFRAPGDLGSDAYDSLLAGVVRYLGIEDATAP
jgi:AcrR family transcriptional regulator